MERVKRNGVTFGSVLAFGFMALLPHQAAWAQQMTGTVNPGGLNVPEEGQLVQLTYIVTNNTGVPMVLDWAACTIQPNPGDNDDNASWPAFSPPGWGASLPAFAQDNFVTTFEDSDPPPLDDTGSATSPVQFYSEWSPYGGGVVIQPLPAGIPLVGALIITNPLTDSTLTPNLAIDPATGKTYYAEDLAALETFQVPNPNNPPMFVGGVQAIPTPVTSSITVFDVPEPASLALVAVGAFGLLTRPLRRNGKWGAARESRKAER